MALTCRDYMPTDQQLFRRSFTEALADYLWRRYGSAKAIGRRFDLDPSTIENIRKGSVSITPLLKIVVMEGRDLWEALGDEIYGETIAEHEERKLQAILKEAEDARRRLEDRRARRARLDQVAGDADEARRRPGHG